MNRRQWKQIESDWAERLGGVRVPVTGRHSGDVPDVEHPLYAIEVKAGKVMSARLREGMKQAVKAGEATGRLPLLCASHSTPGRPSEHYVILRFEDFQTLTQD